MARKTSNDSSGDEMLGSRAEHLVLVKKDSGSNAQDNLPEGPDIMHLENQYSRTEMSRKFRRLSDFFPDIH